MHMEVAHRGSTKIAWLLGGFTDIVHSSGTNMGEMHQPQFLDKTRDNFVGSLRPTNMGHSQIGPLDRR